MTKAASGPEMISLAGGQPNPALFPITGLSFTANGHNHTLSSKMVAKGLQVNYIYFHFQTFLSHGLKFLFILSHLSLFFFFWEPRYSHRSN